MNLPKSNKPKIIAAAAVIVIFVGSGLAYYFSVYAATPEYAVRQIENAVAKHDVALFNRYVNLDSIALEGYDDFTAGLLTTQNSQSAEVLTIIRDFGRIIKNPLMSGFKTAVTDFVETGSWESSSLKEDGIDTDELVSRLGLSDFSVKEIKNIVKSDELHAAGEIVLCNKNDAAEFTLNVVFVRDSGDWRLNGITNIREYILFVNNLRRQKLAAYLDESDKIISKHDEIIRNADFEFQRILSRGSLGKDATRAELKMLTEETVAEDWKERKADLSALSVPGEAVNLQRLRLRICDLHISYAEGYAQWMSDKKVATIRAAEGELKQARTLEGEAEFLKNRMRNATAVANEVK